MARGRRWRRSASWPPSVASSRWSAACWPTTSRPSACTARSPPVGRGRSSSSPPRPTARGTATRSSACTRARRSPCATVRRSGSATCPSASRREGDALDVLAGTLDALRTPAIGGLPPLTSGLVGALGWDIVRHWEPTLPANAPDELGVPELTLLLATDLAVVDHHDGSVWLVANAINFDDTDERVDDAHADAVARLDAMQAAAAAPGGARPGGARRRRGAVADLPRRRARSSRTRCARGQEAIRDGEVFQVVLSQRLDLDCPADPLDVYRVLRTINPSPYMYYLQLQDADGRDFAVVGSSPETLVKVTSGRVVTFPIAGSRPRGATPEEDLRCRTRCSRTPRSAPSTSCSSTCRATTSSRSASRRASRSSSSWRSSATRTSCTSARRSSAGSARVRPRCRRLIATFPAGTLSGAPKPRAIALIDQIEPARRGIYGGTVGYFDFAGDMDMAIAIRTALIREGRASVQAGRRDRGRLGPGARVRGVPEQGRRRGARRPGGVAAAARGRVSGPARRTGGRGRAAALLLVLAGLTALTVVPVWFTTRGSTALEGTVDDHGRTGTDVAPGDPRRRRRDPGGGRRGRARRAGGALGRRARRRRLRRPRRRDDGLGARRPGRGGGARRRRPDRCRAPRRVRSRRAPGRRSRSWSASLDVLAAVWLVVASRRWTGPTRRYQSTSAPAGRLVRDPSPTSAPTGTPSAAATTRPDLGHAGLGRRERRRSARVSRRTEHEGHQPWPTAPSRTARRTSPSPRS